MKTFAFSLAIVCSALVFVDHAARAQDARDREQARPKEHLRIGAIGSAGFPRPLAVEGMVKIERRVALGFEYGALPPTTIGGVHAILYALSGDARIFPLDGPLFVGARLGRQHLAADATVRVPQYGTFAGSASVDTWFVNPRIGVLWTSSAGITLGVDAGLQIPLSSRGSSTLAGTGAGTVATATLDAIGQSLLPTIDLLELGLLF